MKLDFFGQPKGVNNKAIMDDTVWWETAEGMPQGPQTTQQQDTKQAMLMTNDESA